MKLQTPSIVLPILAPLGTETEAVADVLTHISLEFPVGRLQEKVVHITAAEVVVAGAPGNLWAWIELSPFASTLSAAYWAAIGGGGGPSYPLVPALAPVAPVIIAGTGVNLVVHTFFIPWVVHSEFARLVIQTPVPGAAAFWIVQAIVAGK